MSVFVFIALYHHGYSKGMDYVNEIKKYKDKSNKEFDIINKINHIQDMVLRLKSKDADEYGILLRDRDNQKL